MPRREYVVTCDVCRGDLLVTRWFDVADRFADRHVEATGHDCEIEIVDRDA